MARDFTQEIERLRQAAVDAHRKGWNWQNFRSFFGGRVAFLEQELGSQGQQAKAIEIVDELQSLVANGPPKDSPPFPVTPRAEHVD